MNDTWSDQTKEYLSLPEVKPKYEKFKSEFLRRFPTLDFNSLFFWLTPNGKLSIRKSSPENTHKEIDDLINETKFPAVRYFKPFSLSEDIGRFGQELNESKIINEIENKHRALFKPYELKSHFNVLVSSLEENIGSSTSTGRDTQTCIYGLECLIETPLPLEILNEIREKVPNLNFVDVFSV